MLLTQRPVEAVLMAQVMDLLVPRSGAASFAEAWALVSRAPARALGLHDRGVIAPGKRADLVLVEEGPHPRIVATIAGGRLVHLADQRLLA